MSVHNLKFTDHELAKAAGYSDYRELAKAVREQHDPAVVAAERQELQMAADMAWQDQLAKAPPLPAGQARLDAMIAKVMTERGVDEGQATVEILKTEASRAAYARLRRAEATGETDSGLLLAEAETLHKRHGEPEETIAQTLLRLAAGDAEVAQLVRDLEAGA